ncbi:MAG: S8 family serine peptidase [Candidatus Krumholzibacteriia bacterium]
MSQAHVPEQVIIKFKDTATQQDKDRVLSDLRAVKLKHFKRIKSDLESIEGLSVDEAIGRYKNHPAVAIIEPNYLLHAIEIPNDPMFDQLWGMRNTGQTGGTAGAHIFAENAWDVFTGSDQVVIGVIDTGVDYNHPDLAANIYVNPGEIPGNGIDDDGNGFIDDVRGWDFINNDNDPMDDNGHGSHCAGTIGAVGNNGIGVAGVNWNVKIMPLKFLSGSGSGSTADAIEAIEYATMMGVHLTSNSWGGGGYSDAMRLAIADAQDHGILFVAAAGNSGSNNDVSPHYPSNYDLDNVVSVAATDHNDALASFSCYGPTTVDLAAPGVDILSTLPGNRYGSLSGTSMATPHVAGALGLVFGRFPAITGGDAKALLLNFVDPLTALEGRILTGGRLNAFFPIADPDTIPPGQVTDLAAVETGSNWADLVWTAPGDDGDEGEASRYDVRWSTSAIDESNFSSAERATNTPSPDPFGTPQGMRVAGLDFNTTYYFAVRAMDEFGNAGPVSNLAMATTLGIPDVAMTPSSLSEALMTGGTAVQQLTLMNAGEGTLDWTAPLPVLMGMPPTVQAYQEYGKDQLDPRTGDPVVQGSGGPDGFGYRWTDSNDPFGPTFAWLDISGSGGVAIGSGDDVSAGPFPLSFPFSFYGGEFDEFWVSSNGSLSLSSSASPYSNQPLPNPGAPPHLIAPFWDDLVVSGTVYWEDLGDRVVVQWHDVAHYSAGGPYSFQAILWADGTIDFQYETMGDPLNSATVGIQNGDGTDGLQVAYNTAYVEDGLAVRIRAVPQWMTVTPQEGTVYGGGSTILDVAFDATGLFGGTYEGFVRILSNDPDEPDFQLPVTLEVTGAPDLSVAPVSLEFGGVFLGATPTAEVLLTNLGTDVVTVSAVTSSEAAFTFAPGAPIALAPRQTEAVTVTFTPTAAQDYAGTLTITSDDPDEPTIMVALAGSGLEPPQFDITPPSLVSDLMTGGSETQLLTVTNSGGADFTFSLAVNTDVVVTVHESVEFGKDELDARTGEPVTQGAGGPDVFGYQWIDSDEPGGPTYAWVDISATGTPVFSGYSDDTNSGPRPIGFDFPFYGESFSEFRVCSNGWVSFTSSSTSYSNQLLPNSGYSVPENLLAPFWDDLKVDPANGSQVYYEYLDGKLVIQFHNVPRYSSGGPYTFEILLYPNGNIVYQYENMQGQLTSATVGIQNGTKDDGLTAAFNTSYIHDGLAVRFASAPEWLAVTPAQGVVPPGGSMQLTAQFNAEGLFGGTYTGSIDLTTNDPVSPEHAVAAVLNVTGAPDIQLSLDSIDFGEVMLGYPDLRQLTVFNMGTDDLVISACTADHGDFTVNLDGAVTLPPMGQLLLDVRYSPCSAQQCTGMLTFNCNDPDEPARQVALSGTGVIPPVAGVSAGSLSADLYTGQQETRTFNLTNNGGSSLDFTTQTVLSSVVHVAQGDYVELEKDAQDTRPGVLGSGGPDAHGYRWLDSDEAGGPSFNWIDISATGTPIFTSYSDDGNRGPYPIGFEFPFYGTPFSEFRVCSNGWISFTSTRTSYNNQPLPNTGYTVPENLLAVFWDDLKVDPANGSQVYYEYLDGKLVIQFHNVPRLTSGGPYTFQAVLFPTGTILFQYLSMQGTRLDEATVGIQNAERDDGLNIVFNADYVHDNLAIRIGMTPQWITPNPATGSVPAGGSLPITVTFDATGMFGGDYEGAVQVLSNDPARGMLEVATLLSVTGMPDVAVDPAAMDFGSLFVGLTAEQTLTVTNSGTDLLSISSIAPGLADYTVDVPAIDLPPMQSTEVVVTFAPAAEGDRSTNLVLTSNDPDSPLIVPLSGQGVLPPDVAVSPTEIETAAMPGATRTKTISVCNEGDSDLTFTAGSAETLGDGVVQYESVDLEKEQEDTRPGIMGTGGPDNFGYTWTDSDEPGGPVYDWVDISAVGTPIFGRYVDDGNDGPLPIGFTFPFYGNDFDEFRVCTNGFISFTSTATRYSNGPLPSASTGVPENLLAVFWDDMVNSPTNGNEVYYHNDGTRLIVQFELRRIAQYSPPYYSFQAILYPSGEIVYQYRQLGPTTNSATIGLQNAERDDGLMVVFNESYVHESMAIRFSSAPAWLTVEPATGTVAPGECTELTVTFNAAGLDDGDHAGSVDLATNDPDEPLVSIPVLLHVGLMEAVWADFDPNTLNLDSNGKTVVTYCELPEGWAAADVDITTVTFLNEVTADQRVYSLTEDTNGNGVLDCMFKFDRAAIEGILPEGDDVPVTVFMEVANSMWFAARDTIRVIRPRVVAPNGGQMLMAGSPYDIQWENPDDWRVDYADLLYSPDGGTSWSLIATGVPGTTYSWTVPVGITQEALVRVMLYDDKGAMGYDTSDATFQVTDSATAIRESGLPTAFALRQNVPNPFNPVTEIRFDLPQAAHTKLSIYDLRGRLIRTLVDAELPGGFHSAVWDGKDGTGIRAASGVYIYTIEAGSFVERRRMALVK